MNDEEMGACDILISSTLENGNQVQYTSIAGRQRFNPNAAYAIHSLLFAAHPES
jgi:hypothetical protein